MALRKINADYREFEFITNSLRRLELWGSLISWTDEINTGLSEHLILKREGAIHQRTTTPPRKFTAQCTFLGSDVGKRYRALADAINEDPTGRMNHPRFGSVRVVCNGVQSKEDPSESTDEVQFSISFSESGLRTSERPNADSIAAGAVAQANTFTGGLPASFTTFGAALRGSVSTLGSQITSARSIADSIETHRTLAEVAQQTTALQQHARARGQYDAYAQAAITQHLATQAVQASEAQRPRVITYQVPADMSLSRLCATLYGGARARAMCAEILAVNRLLSPVLILAGTLLTIPDPGAIRVAA